MVFLDTGNNGNRGFYNVTKAVGYGCSNLMDDVKMVQFFLKRINRAHQFYKTSETMKVDGYCGPITRRWIVQFQIYCRKQGNNYMIDGIVDKAGNENNPDKMYSSISKTIYTVRALNNGMFWLDREVYQTLSTNSKVPDDVRLIFKKAQAESKPEIP